MFLAALFVIAQTMWAQYNAPLSVTMVNGQTTTIPVSEYVEAINLTANGIGDFYGEVTF